MTSLPLPRPGRDAAEAFVAQHLAHLVCDDVRGADSFTGGQTAADSALAAFDVALIDDGDTQAPAGPPTPPAPPAAW